MFSANQNHRGKTGRDATSSVWNVDRQIADVSHE